MKRKGKQPAYKEHPNKYLKKADYVSFCMPEDKGGSGTYRVNINAAAKGLAQNIDFAISQSNF